MMHEASFTVSKVIHTFFLARVLYNESVLREGKKFRARKRKQLLRTFGDARTRRSHGRLPLQLLNGASFRRCSRCIADAIAHTAHDNGKETPDSEEAEDGKAPPLRPNGPAQYRNFD